MASGAEARGRACGSGRGATQAWLLVFASAACLQWALGVVPYHVPVRPVVSESYVFGYSNRAGAALVAVWLLALAVWGPRLRVRDRAGKPLTARTLRRALVISFAVAFVLYLLTRGLNGLNESPYFLHRLRLVLAGERPFRDFEFAYGAGLLYGPALLAWGLHLPAGDAYGIFWILASLAGVWLLYGTLRGLEAFAGAQRPVFLLLWAYSVVNLFSLGVNYSLLRFALPCFLAVRIDGRLRAAGPDGVAVTAILLPVPCFAVLLLVSPELAVAFAVGMAVYLLVVGQVRRRERAVLWVTMLLGLAGVAAVAQRMGVFATMRGFSRGGYNFPLLPVPHLWLLYGLAGVCALFAGRAVRRREPDGLLALVAVSAVALVSALGRCDQVHAMLNPLGLVVAGLVLLSGYPWLRLGVFAGLWWLLVVRAVLPLTLGTSLVIAKAELPAFFAYEAAHGGGERLSRIDQRVLAHMTTKLGPVDARDKFERMRFYGAVRDRMDVDAIFGLPRGTKMYAPYGFSPDRAGLYPSPAVDEGYYLTTVNVNTPEQVERKRAELLAHRAEPLLLLPDFRNGCAPLGESSRALVEMVFGSRYDARPVHTENLYAPLCAAIEAHWHAVGEPTPQRFGYELWMPDGR